MAKTGAAAPRAAGTNTNNTNSAGANNNNTTYPPAAPHAAAAEDKASTTTANDEEKGTLASPRRDEKAYGESEDEEDEDGADGAPGGRLRDLGQGETMEGFKREHWWQIWRPRNPPPPPSKSFDDAAEIPLATANIFSALTFHWVSPIMKTGYQRPLQATDLWKMDHSREADYLSDRFLANLEKRQKTAAEWNEKLPTAVAPWTTRTKWAFTAATKHHLPPNFAAYGSDKSYAERKATLEAEWRGHSGKQKGSITWALNDTFPNFWWAGVYKLFADEAQLMAPLLVKALINFSKEMYLGNHHQGKKPNVGRGIGMAIGMFCLAIMQTVCQHQFFFLSMQTGAMSRAALISAVYKRSLRLSVRARSNIPNGKLMAHLSSDISRIDYCAQWFHAIWTAPIQLIVTLILLCLQIGPSAIVGFSLFIILTPLQTYIMKLSLMVRKKSMVFTDGRSKLLQEILSSMQIIKVFTYELPFLKRLEFLRNMEMKSVRKIAYIRAANMSLAFSVPALATVLSFVTYTSTHKNLDPAILFTALALFNLLRQPLLFLPRALSTYADAKNAVERLTDVFEAELMEEKDMVDPNLDVAIRAKGATFQWASVPEVDQIVEGKGGKGKGKKDKTDKTPAKTPPKTPPVQDADATPAEVREPFKVEDLNLEIPRGRLVAIVGPVGSGKSSILQGLLGEMRTLSGTVEFGGRAGYCQQSAWIQNATLRDNILFGQKWDESRYWQCVADASLLADLEILPDGDLTEIGEKGVNLSGGQKQRVNIARAMYFNSEIVLFDDPLSAVDAHVGKALFNDAILGLRSRGKTVVLVTHALHLLPQVDYIYTVGNGHIVEQGTYDSLVSSGGAFKRLMDEFGGQQEAKQEEEAAEEEDAIAAIPLESPVDEKLTSERVAKLTRKSVGKAAGTGKLEGRLMQSEVRKTGSVGRKVYAAYLKAGDAAVTLPLILVFGIGMQTASVLSTVWLTWWEADSFHKSMGFYQGMYAFLNISQALIFLLMGLAMAVLSYLASKNMYNGALQRVMFSPMSFFDTNPTGRIMGIFGKDVDMMDNQLADALRMQAITLFSMVGSVVIITVFFHYFIIVMFVVGLGYLYFAQYYRTSAREMKRLDSMLRSLLYAHFSESLSGLATIRAYGETSRFIKENSWYMDLEDRAYLLTSANQRWLAVRLDFLGAILVFCVAVMSAAGGAGLTPAQIGLCLTYMTQITQLLGMLTRQSAEVENNMNAIERIMYYSDGGLPQEAAYNVEPEPQNWPSAGNIKLDKVVMSYRKGLPPVLKGISAEFKSGEKIGIIGRTGAGKTSITVALYRLAELTSGKITIDDVDISGLGLQTLRSHIAIIPQDPVLFSGTLRSNLDPFNLYEDVKLYDALKRACLIDETGHDGADPATTRTARFTLDMPIDDEGSNLSIGERSLVSLARALVKDSRIVVLDEATAAVDLETDAKIQETIRREFGSKTLLCIAHRLRTIISWDRILVMNAGEIEDFGTPLDLFDAGGLFRTLCERSHISREEITRARKEETFA